MTWAASAITEPVPSIDNGPLNADAPSMVLHTAVSNATDLKSFWQSGAAGPGVGSHFYINKTGTVYEYVALERKTGHAFAANEFAWGLESWDGGLSIPWNDAQLDAIIELCKELKVPARILPENGKGGGVGYHRQYTSWNQNAHTCPGDLRVAQVPTIIGGIAMAAIDDVAAACGMTKDAFITATLSAASLGAAAAGNWNEPANPDRKAALDYLKGLSAGGGGVPAPFDATITPKP